MTIGNPDVRMAFRFIKQHVIREDNDLPKPDWTDFTDDDMFDSVSAGRPTRTGYTPDGDSEVSQMVIFRLGNDPVAMVFLNGLQTPWGTTWTVTRVIYSLAWSPTMGVDASRVDKSVDQNAYTGVPLNA